MHKRLEVKEYLVKANSEPGPAYCNRLSQQNTTEFSREGRTSGGVNSFTRFGDCEAYSLLAVSAGLEAPATWRAYAHVYPKGEAGYIYVYIYIHAYRGDMTGSQNKGCGGTRWDEHGHWQWYGQ